MSLRVHILEDCLSNSREQELRLHRQLMRHSLVLLHQREMLRAQLQVLGIRGSQREVVPPTTAPRNIPQTSPLHRLRA